MQKKLEAIENKLNFFIESSPKKTPSESQSIPVLDSDEAKLLQQARKEIYAKFETPSEPTKSFRSSVNGAKEKSMASDQVVIETYKYKKHKVTPYPNRNIFSSENLIECKLNISGLANFCISKF